MRVASSYPDRRPTSSGGGPSGSPGVSPAGSTPTPRTPAEVVDAPSPEGDLVECDLELRGWSSLGRERLRLSWCPPSTRAGWSSTPPHHVVLMFHTLRGLYDYLRRGPAAVERLLGRAGGPRAPRSRCPPTGARSRCPRSSRRFRDLVASPRCRPPGVALPRHAGPRAGPLPRPGGARPLGGEAATSASPPPPWPCKRATPIGVTAGVLVTPSNLRGASTAVRFEHLFTPAALDRPKRSTSSWVAMRHVRSDVIAQYAGTGPDEERLRGLAAARSPHRAAWDHVPDDELVVSTPTPSRWRSFPADEDSA